MTKLTERENLLRVYNGEIPDWVPIAERVNQGCFGPPFLTDWAGKKNEFGIRDKKAGEHVFDRFGVEHEIVDPRIGAMPAPGIVKVSDIRKWREEYPLSTWPDLDSLDWLTMARTDTAVWDRENKYQKVSFGGSGSGSAFVWAATILGHTSAMMAMLTEEEAWHDLVNEFTLFQEKLISYVGQYYKPDSIMMCDDVAYNPGTFMSPDTYRECIKPYHKRMMDAIAKAGCTPEVHCCGKVDAIIDDFVEIGVRSWDPAQYFNDMEGIKERHGNKLIMHGGWDSNGPASNKGASEEEVRAAVRSSIDRGAPGGGYVFTTSGMTLEYYVGKDHYGWIYDEAEKYGASFYK